MAASRIQSKHSQTRQVDIYQSTHLAVCLVIWQIRKNNKKTNPLLAFPQLSSGSTRVAWGNKVLAFLSQSGHTRGRQLNYICLEMNSTSFGTKLHMPKRRKTNDILI